MTIPLCERHKTVMKPGCPPLKTFNNFLVQYGLKKQAHYKVRGGECVQCDLAVPHSYFLSTFTSLNILKKQVQE